LCGKNGDDSRSGSKKKELNTRGEKKGDDPADDTHSKFLFYQIEALPLSTGHNWFIEACTATSANRRVPNGISVEFQGEHNPPTVGESVRGRPNVPESVKAEILTGKKANITVRQAVTMQKEKGVQVTASQVSNIR
jgi:hypothetical protein